MEKDVLVQKERGFIEKFMVPQMYDLFRFGGSSVKDDEMGMQRMLQNFSGLFTEEQLRKNMEKYNLQKMFGVVKEYFKKEYGYAGDSIILSIIISILLIVTYIMTGKIRHLSILMNCLNLRLLHFSYLCLSGRKILETWRFTVSVN